MLISLQFQSSRLWALDVTTYNFEGVGNDANSLELLSVVATVHHERVGETFDDGALGFAEALDGISSSGMRDVDRAADLNIVAVYPIDS